MCLCLCTTVTAVFLFSADRSAGLFTHQVGSQAGLSTTRLAGGRLPATPLPTGGVFPREPTGGAALSGQGQSVTLIIASRSDPEFKSVARKIYVTATELQPVEVGTIMG